MKELFEHDEELKEFVKKLPNSWRDKGLQESKEQGLIEGRREGKKEGIKLGEKEAKIEIAQNMNKTGMDPKLIIEITGLNSD